VVEQAGAGGLVLDVLPGPQCAEAFAAQGQLADEFDQAGSPVSAPTIERRCGTARAVMASQSGRSSRISGSVKAWRMAFRPGALNGQSAVARALAARIGLVVW